MRETVQDDVATERRHGAVIPADRAWIIGQDGVARLIAAGGQAIERAAMASPKIAKYDMVILSEQIHGVNIKKGALGVVVHVYEDGVCAEVEFVCKEANDATTVTVEIAMLARAEDLLHMPDIAKQIEEAKEQMRKRIQELNE